MKRERGSTIHRVLDILDIVAGSEEPISATEINDKLNLPKATAHRLCAELESQGYLIKRINGKSYMPGNRLHDIAVGVLAHSRFRTQRHAILQRLSEEIGESCNIAYPDGAQMTYADRVETQWPLRLQIAVGTRVPLYCTASGKLYLSSLPKSKREAMAASLDLKAITKNTITDPSSLLDAVEKIRRDQISIDNEEYIDGIIAIAVPITDNQGRFYNSVALQAPVFRMPLQRAREYIPLLREAAEKLSTLTDD
jgi:IclR family acetate operon transcriptional repressor